jgi:hypothetical protein
VGGTILYRCSISWDYQFLQNSTKSIEVDDVSVGQFVKFLFTGSFDSKMTIETALALLEIKEKYMMPCEGILDPIDIAFKNASWMTIDQVWPCIAVAIEYQLLDSLEVIKKFVWQHHKQFGPKHFESVTLDTIKKVFTGSPDQYAQTLVPHNDKRSSHTYFDSQQ